jgi:hypothetical protein
MVTIYNNAVYSGVSDTTAVLPKAIEPSAERAQALLSKFEFPESMNRYVPSDAIMD